MVEINREDAYGPLPERLVCMVLSYKQHLTFAMGENQ